MAEARGAAIACRREACGDAAARGDPDDEKAQPTRLLFITLTRAIPLLRLVLITTRSGRRDGGRLGDSTASGRACLLRVGSIARTSPRSAVVRAVSAANVDRAADRGTRRSRADEGGPTRQELYIRGSSVGSIPSALETRRDRELSPTRSSSARLDYDVRLRSCSAVTRRFQRVRARLLDPDRDRRAGPTRA